MDGTPSTNEILKTLRGPIEGIGLRKKDVGHYVVEVAPDFLGTVGFGTTAGGYPKGVRGVWPVVGIRHAPTEDLLEMFGRKRVFMATISTQVGHLLPRNTWTEYPLSTGPEYDVTREELAAGIETAAPTFWEKHLSAEAVLAAVEAGLGGPPEKKRAILLLLLGRKTEALAAIDEAVARLPGPPNGYTEHMLAFADMFRRHVAETGR